MLRQSRYGYVLVAAAQQRISHSLWSMNVGEALIPALVHS
jgi:hypothetical protein